MSDIPRDLAGQLASGGQSSGGAYPNAAHETGNYRGGQSLRGYHGPAHGGETNAAERSANNATKDRRGNMADYDRYGRDNRSRDRNMEDRGTRGAGYAGRTWAERTGDELASWAGDRDAEYRRERDRDRLGRYPGEEAGERRYTTSRDGGFGSDSRDDSRSGGVGYGGRNWAERTGDEVASWAGDRDAEYRRERDRDRLGRYPGEESGERRYGSDSGRYGQGAMSGSTSRYGSGREGRDDERTVPGSGYQGRNWAERAGDEVQSWVGDRDAEYRREQDRQRLGRYPGEDAGERLTGSGRSGYDDRYTNDRDGYRGGSGTSQSGQGGQTAYGSYGGGGGQTAYGNPGSTGGNDRSFGPSGGYGGADYQTSQSSFRTDRSGNEASRDFSSGDPTRTYAASSTGGRTERQYPQAELSDDENQQSDDRGFFTRAADEVASWFGDEEAERRRQLDQMREDSRDAFDGSGGQSGADPSFAGATGFSSAGASRPAHDPYYANYRNQRAAELDQDFSSYDEERRKTFETDFFTWRSKRKQGGAAEGSGMSGNALAAQVREHATVEGSDGKTVGTVDRVMGGDIKLAKKDSPDGKHHLIPMSWVAKVEGERVCLTKTADEAKAEWRDEEGSSGSSGA